MFYIAIGAGMISGILVGYRMCKKGKAEFIDDINETIIDTSKKAYKKGKTKIQDYRNKPK